MALKKILIRKDDKVFADMIRNEVKIWKELGKHPNIVELYDFCTVEEDGGKYVIVLMEICEDGHLLDLLERHSGKLSENAIIAIMEQITKGICYMHSQSPPVAH
jgi:AP2-associated kinase